MDLLPSASSRTFTIRRCCSLPISKPRGRPSPCCPELCSQSRSGCAAVALARSRGDALAGPTHAARRRPRRDCTRAATSARAFLGRTHRRLCLFIFLHQSQHVSPQGTRGRAAALARPSLLYGRRELPPYRGLLQVACDTNVSIPCRQPHDSCMCARNRWMLPSVPRPTYASPTNPAPYSACSTCPPLFSQKPQLRAHSVSLSYTAMPSIFFNWVQKLADQAFYSVYPPLDGVDGFLLII